MKRKIVIFSLVATAGSFFWLAPHFADTADLQKNSGAKPTAAASAQGKKGQGTATTGRFIAVPVADTNAAPQIEFDNALYKSEEFFGVNAKVLRPFNEARKQVDELLGKYPQDAKLYLQAAALDERLEQFDKAAANMEKYVTLKSNSPGALRRLAIFYHNRAQFKEHVQTLEKLAKAVRPEESELIYREILGVIAAHDLKEFSPEYFYKEMIAANGENATLVKEYIGSLKLKQQYDSAIKIIDTYQPKYINEQQFFLKTRAEIFELQNRREQAEAVYEKSFDPLWDNAIVADYYELLRKFGKYRVYRRALQSDVASGTNFDKITRLFRLYCYEGNQPAAAVLLNNYETKRGKQNNWNARELETLAGLYLQIGQYDQASRYLYTLHMQGGLENSSAKREETLYRIFKVLVDAGDQAVRLNSGDLTFYKDVATIDQEPGFLNGVLSLILSGESVSGEFASKETQAASYFNRAFAYRIFNSYKQEFAKSEKLPFMYEDLLTIFSSFGEHKLVVELGKQYQTQFPQARNYDQVTIKIADAQVALNNRDGERATLIQLLDKVAKRAGQRRLLKPAKVRSYIRLSPEIQQLVQNLNTTVESYSDEYQPGAGANDVEETGDSSIDDFPVAAEPDDGSGRPTYSSLLERIVASYTTSDKKMDTLRFFSAELKKHPDEEGLYERMLKWLSTTDIIGEQLKVYNAATKQFQDTSWYHRFARWFIRNSKRDDFKKYSREIVEAFEQEDIKEYLEKFAQFSAKNVSDVNYDSKLYFELYSYAHKRFPNNISFVNGLLNYYANQKQWKEWSDLSLAYYPVDKSIRDNLIAYYQSKDLLTGQYKIAQDQIKNGNSYKLFASDAAMALSHFNEAVDTYRDLSAQYPGELQFSSRLADLTRSLSYNNDKLAQESATIYIKLSRIYPTDHTYKTKAGEVLAELSDFAQARQMWDNILNVERGVPNTYLEVASIYWDYFQFDDAVRTIKDLRITSNNPTALAYKMGAIYEGKSDWKQAVNEYVSVLSETGPGRDVVIRRLVQLTPRRDNAQVIARAYEQRANAKPEDWLLALGYSEYLRQSGRDTDADSLLRQQLAKRDDLGFVEAAREIFHRERLANDEEQAIIRLGQLARDERESMKYRLQLAAFYEQRKDMQKSTNIFDQLVASYPSNLGIIQEATQYYWRANLIDKSIDLYKQSAGRAKGAYQKQFTLELANRYRLAKRYDESEQILRAWYKDHSLDNDFFSALVSLLGETGKQEALVELYKDGLKQATANGLSGDEATNYKIQLRLSMINTLSKLNQHSEVIDQYIEIINRQPFNTDMVQAAFRYAQLNGQLERFTRYYENTAKKSFKDYRWNLILANIYGNSGDTAKEVEQYKLATTNEPQRLDIRDVLADRLTRLQRYDEAIVALRKNLDIDAGNVNWLERIASVQIQAGRPDDAVATLRDKLSRLSKITVAVRFQAGQMLANGGYTKQALDFYQEAINAIKANPSKEAINLEQLNNYGLAMIKVVGPVKTYNDVKQLKAVLVLPNAESDPDYYNRAYFTKAAFDGFFRDYLGQYSMQYASPKDRADLAAVVKDDAQKVKGAVAVKLPILKEYVALAKSAGLTELEESLSINIKDIAFGSDDANSEYYTDLTALLNFYDRFALYRKAAELLESEKKLNRWKEKNNSYYITYYNLLVSYWRKAGDSERELATLREYYNTRTGDIAGDVNPLVALYFTALVEQGKRDELQQLAAKSNAYQLQLINFLAVRKEKDLALQAIDNTNLSAAWKASRKAQVHLYFRDTGKEVEKNFLAALDIKPIKQMVGSKVDQNKTLYGNDWYVTASNYGVWLNLVGGRNNDVKKYIVARTESRPNDASAQLELASFYTSNKKFDAAEQHLNLAAELAPKSPAVKVAQGNYFYARGDRDRAIASWNTLIADRRAGVLEYSSYFNALSSHELTAQALPVMQKFFSRALTRLSFDQLSDLVRQVAQTGNKSSDGGKAVADMFYNVMRDNPEDVALGSMLLKEDLILPIETRSLAYQVVLDRYSDQVLNAMARGEYSSGSGVDLQMENHERRYIDFLISRNQFDEARRQVGYMEDLNRELNREVTPEWLLMAKAVVELRKNNSAEAIALLRNYAGLGAPTTAANNNGQTNYYLKAYTLLANEGQKEPANQLLYDYYLQRLRAGDQAQSNYSGIAVIEFERNKKEEGMLWLKRMTAALNNADAYVEAGRLAAEYGAYKEALAWREKAQQLNGALTDNRLEIARLYALNGNYNAGADNLIKLIDNREVNNALRAQAMELLPQIVKNDANVLNSLIQRYSAVNEYNGQVVYAGLLIAATRNDEAHTVLQKLNQLSTATQPKLMLAALELKSGNRNGARDALLAAQYSDSNGYYKNALAFNYEDPRIQLAQIYLDSGIPKTALALFATGVVSEGTDSQDDSYTEYKIESFNFDALKASNEQGRYNLLSELATIRNRDARKKLFSALIDTAIKVGDLPRAIELLASYRTELTDEKEIAVITQRSKELSTQLSNSQATQNANLAALRLDRTLTVSVLEAELKNLGLLSADQNGEGQNE